MGNKVVKLDTFRKSKKNVQEQGVPEQDFDLETYRTFVAHYITLQQTLNAIHRSVGNVEGVINTLPEKERVETLIGLYDHIKHILDKTKNGH